MKLMIMQDLVRNKISHDMSKLDLMTHCSSDVPVGLWWGVYVHKFQAQDTIL